MGCKPKYNNAGELRAAVDAYFKNCEGEPLKDDSGEIITDKYGAPIIVGAHPPTVTGLALALGFRTRQSLLDYQARSKAFNDIITEAKSRCEEYAERRLYDRDGVNGAKFSLVNNFKGWKDKSDADNSAALSKPDGAEADTNAAADITDIIPPQFMNAHRYIKNHVYTEYTLPGGRGSGKSSFVSAEIPLIMQRDPDINALVLRKYSNTLKDTVFNQLIWAIDKHGLADKFKITTNPMQMVYLPTGQTIYFRGLDDPLKIKSIKPKKGYIGIIWFEELDQFGGRGEIRSVEQSAKRGGDKFFVFKTFNPPISASNWANEYAAEEKEGKTVIKSSYLDMPPEWLGDEFIADAEFLKQTDERAYRHEYLGEPTGTGGSVFENVTVRKISGEEKAQFDRVCMGIDWGWYPDPFAFHKVHYDAARRKLFIFEEYRCNKQGNAETYKHLTEKMGVTPSDLIIADSAEPKSIGDYRAYGLSCRAVEKYPGSVADGMKWLQSLAEIVIDVSCKGAAEEFMHYEYERSRDGEIISGYPDKNNHSIDAVRYATSLIWRKRGT